MYTLRNLSGFMQTTKLIYAVLNPPSLVNLIISDTFIFGSSFYLNIHRDP